MWLLKNRAEALHTDPHSTTESLSLAQTQYSVGQFVDLGN